MIKQTRNTINRQRTKGLNVKPNIKNELGLILHGKDASEWRVLFNELLRQRRRSLKLLGKMPIVQRLCISATQPTSNHARDIAVFGIIQLLLQQAIASLPEKQRVVFNLKYFEQMKYEEMSTLLDTSVGALKASYHLAVKKIQHFFEQYD